MTTQKILFCDDSIKEPGYLKSIVESANCVLIITKTGNDAIEKAKLEKPDFIYMNILSLGAEGYSVMLSLRNNPDTRSIPLIFYSGPHQTADSIWFKMQSERYSKLRSNFEGTSGKFPLLESCAMQ
ncbi:MAG: two-component system response regulator [Methylomicrobium sp.]